MAITLSDLEYDVNQDPVGVNRPFVVTLQIDFDPTTDSLRDGVVKFWTLAAYAVNPNSVPLGLAAGENSATRNVTLTLQGVSQPERIRIFAECDERHSVFVRVG